MTALDTTVDLQTPFDDFIARQQSLSAVERFSQRHDAAPQGDRWYRDLLPAGPPAPGQQYRFEVDMDACTSCKSCVTACHSLNGLDEGETWRSVGVLVGTGPTGPTQQTVTTACHHCVDPACLKGCPVDAYEKDPITGIVRHLDDQCIGCSYCTWTCPYEVPSFNERLGIVRKCDMCSDRLADGEAPACVQACPTGAIAIGVVEIAELLAEVRRDVLVPGAPASELAIPSTVYRRSEPLPADSVATDAWSEAPKHAHLPLVVMLVCTQVSVGTFVALTALGMLVANLSDHALRVGAAVAMATGLVAIGASVGHLGRPLQAWRAVIGLRHSWLSREIVAFGVFAPTAVVAAAVRWVQPRSDLADALSALVTVIGLVAVSTSVLIYASTGRRWWRLDRTARAFVVTTAAGGLATISVILAATTDAPLDLARPLRAAALLSVVVTVVALAADASMLRSSGPSDFQLARSARLQLGPLRSTTVARFAWSSVGGVFAPLVVVGLLADPDPAPVAVRVVAVVALAATIRGELAGRQLFFRAMVAPRMPGMPR